MEHNLSPDFEGTRRESASIVAPPTHQGEDAHRGSSSTMAPFTIEDEGVHQGSSSTMAPFTFIEGSGSRWDSFSAMASPTDVGEDAFERPVMA